MVSFEPTHVGQTVTLAGWVHRQRDHGGVTFIDLRDRFGLVQIVANPAQPRRPDSSRTRARNGSCRSPALVRRRPAGAENPNLPTGEIEVDVTSL